MKPRGRAYTVDFFRESDAAPEAGNIVREVSDKQMVKGYLRVLSVRQVRVRVSRGEVARYALRIERLNERPQDQPVAFTVYSYAKPKAPKGHKPDRFDPLLPP